MAHFGEEYQSEKRIPPVLILCGGKGERLGGLANGVPKPMVELGGKPILWHIMKHFSYYGFNDFVLALGFMGWVVDYYFKDKQSFPEKWNVKCIPTGWDTSNGTRIKRLETHLSFGTFMMAWCDGVSNINLADMLLYHQNHGRLCTVATVHPPARFGEMLFDADNIIQSFKEKPQTEGWINGGFFVCEPGIFDYVKAGSLLDGNSVQWERAPMERLAKDGQLVAYPHTGFWRCMDTDKDRRELEEMWIRRPAPWKTWSD